MVELDTVDAVNNEIGFPLFCCSIASRREEAVQNREEYCPLEGKAMAIFTTNFLDDLGYPEFEP